MTTSIPPRDEATENTVAIQNVTIEALLLRTVRMEACTVMGVLAPKAGRGLGRALKSVLGPWYLAQADPHSDTAKNAVAAFRETFPGPKSREAVAYFRTQVNSAL